jgi:hypothetical protein
MPFVFPNSFRVIIEYPDFNVKGDTKLVSLQNDDCGPVWVEIVVDTRRWIVADNKIDAGLVNNPADLSWRVC